MNWFEDQDGCWHNLDQADGAYPRDGGTTARIVYGDEVAELTDDDFLMLKAQLLNGQPQANRRPATALPVSENLSTQPKPTTEEWEMSGKAARARWGKPKDE